MLLAWVSAGFQSLPLLLTIKLGPSGVDSRVSGFVYILRYCGLSSELSCEAGSFSFHCNPHRFLASGSEAFFRYAGNLGCAVCLTRLLFLQFICTEMWTTESASHHLSNAVFQPPPCSASSPPLLPISTPPTSLDECFFFNSLVVGIPYSLILWKFWSFFVFKFVGVLLLVV